MNHTAAYNTPVITVIRFVHSDILTSLQSAGDPIDNDGVMPEDWE